MNHKQSYWTVCLRCQGRGKKSKGISKKLKRRYQNELQQFESTKLGLAPVPPKGHLELCQNCNSSGLVRSAVQLPPDNKNYPHIAIIGGGIGGVALAVACLQRQIPFTLYERDSGFEARSQGYGLTLQQASKAIEGLGVLSLDKGVISTKHVVHSTDGKVLGEWGIRKWGALDTKASSRRTNVHIARQSLRLALLEQLGGHSAVQWGHQLVDFKESASGAVELSFQVKEHNEVGQELNNKGSNTANIKRVQADLVVGADGIRSTMRRLLIGEDASPLRYLGCIVILGICPLTNITETHRSETFFAGAAEGDERVLQKPIADSLLDSATVFQTANGHERIYIMPFDSDSIMWQLSFPMPEQEAKALSAKGPQALKDEACRRCQWHTPIPQILTSTLVAQVSGYPVYDRALLQPEHLYTAAKGAQVTLIGDAAHPMSPFKGQGANQALLDALALARGIAKGCRPLSDWREQGVRASVLTAFEAEMLARSAKKVKDSAAAAEFLHTDVVLHEGDEPRGRCLQRSDNSDQEIKT